MLRHYVIPVKRLYPEMGDDIKWLMLLKSSLRFKLSEQLLIGTITNTTRPHSELSFGISYILVGTEANQACYLNSFTKIEGTASGAAVIALIQWVFC